MAISSIRSDLYDYDQYIAMRQGDAYVQDLQRLAETLPENPDDDVIADLAEHLAELAEAGANGLSPEKSSLLRRDIEGITSEVTSVLDTIPEEVVDTPSSQSTPKAKKNKRHKGFLKRAAGKIAHLARDVGRIGYKIVGGHVALSGRADVISKKAFDKSRQVAIKVNDFFKKHRKAILIGTIAAALAVTVVGLAVAGSTAAASIAASGAGAGGLIAGAQNKKISSDSTKTAVAEETTPSVFSNMMDPGRFLRDAVLQQAVEKAKENRFPGKIYAEEIVEKKRREAAVAFDRFKGNIADIFERKDVGEAIAIGLTAAKATPSKGGLAAVIGATFIASELASRYKDKIDEAYAPVGKIYEELHAMEKANQEASLAQCEKAGYLPKLEYDPTAARPYPDTAVLIDRKNPNPNNQIIVSSPNDSDI